MSTQQRHRIITNLKPRLSFFNAENDKRFSLYFGPEAHGARSGGLYMDKELGSDLLEPHLMALYGQIYKSVKTIINKPMYTGYSMPFGYFEGFRTVLATTHVVACHKKEEIASKLKKLGYELYILWWS